MDGNPQTGSQTLSLAPGNHTLATTTPQSTGVGSQAVFAGWSDSGAISHSINVVSPVTITGTFTTQFQLALSASPVAGRTVTPASGSFPCSRTVGGLYST